MTTASNFWTAAPHPSGSAGPSPDWLRYVPDSVRGLVASHLPPGIADVGQGGWPVGGREGWGGATSREKEGGARFLSASFTNQAGTRPYKLYVPSGYRGEPVPLIVMLHGCSQSPDDFARGTGMNEAAEQRTCIVAYPGQTTQAHGQKCWKWFSADDQKAGSGEPSIIAGITRQVMKDYAIDPRRVFVAGLSAGGAAAAIMGSAYPDLYAAIGVHSGLACGAARDLPSALAAMKRGAAGRAPLPRGEGRVVPAIVFHGDRDGTVSPLNGDDVMMQFTRGAGLRREEQPRTVEVGRSCTRTVYKDGAGQVVAEQWLVHGAGHAWSGGSAAGSYADPSGPSATNEMLRFFVQHPRHIQPAADCTSL